MLYRAFVPHEAESFLHLQYQSGTTTWEDVQEFTPLFEEFVGAWDSEYYSIVVSDEYVDDYLVYKAKFITSSGSLDYYAEPYFAYSDIDTYVKTFTLYTQESEEFGTYYAAKPTEDTTFDICLFDTDWGMEFFYPAVSYYAGEWLGQNGSSTVTVDKDNKKIVINSVEYSFELYNDHGWRFKLTSGDKEGYVAPFIGGFDLVLGDTADTLVAADYESFNGEWYYNGKILTLDSKNKTVKIGDDAAVTGQFKVVDKKLVFFATVDGVELTLSIQYLSVALKAVYGNTTSFLINKDAFDSQLPGTYISLIGGSKSTVTIDSNAALYLDGDLIDTAILTYDTDNSCVIYQIGNYSIYMLANGVICLTDGENTQVFATQTVLKAFNGSWTDDGINVSYTVDLDAGTIALVKDGTSTPVNFLLDFVDGLGLVLFVQIDENATAASKAFKILAVDSLGTVYQYSITDDYNISSNVDSTFIRIEDYSKLVGTYCYDGPQGVEYIKVTSDGHLFVTSSKRDSDGNFITGEYELAEYSFNTMFYYGNDVLAFSFVEPKTNYNVFVYVHDNYAEFFGNKYYVEEIHEAAGVYQLNDGTDLVSIQNDSVRYKGTTYTVTSYTAGEDANTLKFGSYTASYTKEGVLTITDGDAVETYTKREFDITKYFGTFTIADDTNSYELGAFTSELSYSVGLKTTSASGFESIITSYTFELDDNGNLVIVFSSLFTEYRVSLDSDGKPQLSVKDTSSIPLPPPPPSL